MINYVKLVKPREIHPELMGKQVIVTMTKEEVKEYLKDNPCDHVFVEYYPGITPSRWKVRFCPACRIYEDEVERKG